MMLLTIKIFRTWNRILFKLQIRILIQAGDHFIYIDDYYGLILLNTINVSSQNENTIYQFTTTNLHS